MKYGDKVKVTSGFYEGMEGKLINENYYIACNEKKYTYDFRVWFIFILANIPESNLELIK